MLLIRVIPLFCAFWVARCDLLDLYVQHMDETMKTLAYERSHAKNLARARAKRSPMEPLFKYGPFKRHRLEVDENWEKEKAQDEQTRETTTHYIEKDDGLDFPNDREENIDPSSHETLQGSKQSSKCAANPEVERTTTEVEENSRNVEVESSTATTTQYETSQEGLPGSELPAKIVDATEKSGQRESLDVRDREEIENAEDYPEDDPEDDPEEGHPEFEIMNTSDLDEPAVPPEAGPSLKNAPKPNSNRVPKKYFPSEKDFWYRKKFLGNNAAAAAAAAAGSADSPRGISNRPRRSTRDAEFTRREWLDENGKVLLEWDPSDEDVVTFKVTARTLGYVGVGFNEKGNMKGADILLAWVDDHSGAVNLLDSHGAEEANGAPLTDTSQDVRILSGSQNETHTTVTFFRRWQTCDPQDRRLTGDTVRVLWAMHDADPELNTPASHGEKRGSRALRLKAPAPHPPPPPDTPDLIHWDVKLNQYPVPENQDTVYWCKIFKAHALKKKHHMIGYEPLVEKANEALVHHVILYECASTSPILGQHARIAGALCYSPTMPREWESCLQPVLAWARGSKGEWLPEHVGMPIAEHREGSYYMLEVHYNNPELRRVNDSSGVRLHLTPKLRPQEAGILVTGVAVSPLHVVPPRQREFATAGYCTPHCTNSMFPEDGINVVSVVLHSHLAGRRLGLKHIRQGKELPRIVQDNHFDFNYQQSHTLEKEIKVLPGDELVAECVYGTLNRSRPTLGGYAATQEMCLAFVVHYPRTALAACYSITPVKDLINTLGVTSFKGVTFEQLENLFLTAGTDANSLPATSQLRQQPVYPATRPSEQVDEELVKEAESALRAMMDYTDEPENDNVFARLVIEEPGEFRGMTLADHMTALPWTEELLAGKIEQSLYHGKHMTFCRKRDDKLALPRDIQMFPNFTALPEVNDTSCSKPEVVSSAADVPARLFWTVNVVLFLGVSQWCLPQATVF